MTRSTPMAAADARLLRVSLVAVWLGTALASVVEAHGQSATRLAEAGVTAPAVAALLWWGGAALDLVVGLLLWLWPGRAVYAVAFASTLGMTVLASAIAPAWWLDPIAPMLKNLPILAVLWKSTP